MKTYKGYWLQVCFNDNTVNSMPIEKYWLFEKYVKQFIAMPHVTSVVGYVGNKELFQCLEGQKFIMPTLAELNAGFANKRKNSDYRSFASPDDKQALVTLAIPMFIRGIREVLSPFKDENGEPQYNFNYDVDIDTTSPTFQLAVKLKELKSAYTISFITDEQRRAQKEQAFEPDYIPNNKPVVLTKSGRYFMFTDPETPTN